MSVELGSGPCSCHNVAKAVRGSTHASEPRIAVAWQRWKYTMMLGSTSAWYSPLRAIRLGTLASALAILTTLLTAALLYCTYLGSFFLTDDFVFLDTIPVPSTWSEVLEPLNPLRSNAFGFYRPISSCYYFMLAKSMFGLDPAGYFAVNFTFYLLNIALVCALSWRVSKSRLVAITCSYLYGINFIHYETLSWAVGFQDIALTTFSLGCVILFAIYLESGSARTKHLQHLASLLLFVGAIMSKETAVVLPAVLTLYCLCFTPVQRSAAVAIRQLFNQLWPYYLLAVLYLATRSSALRAASSDTESTYHLSLGLEPVYRYMWFIRWVADEFLYPIHLAKSLTAPYVYPGWLIWAVLAPAIIVVLAVLIVLLRRRQTSRLRLSGIGREVRVVIFGAGLFVGTLLPVSIYAPAAVWYLALPAVGAYMAIAAVLLGLLRIVARYSCPTAMGLMVVVWGLITWGAFVRVATLAETGPPMYGQLAKATIIALKAAAPMLPPDATVYLLSFPPTVWPQGVWAEHAVKLYYDNTPVRVVVVDGNAMSIPPPGPLDNVYVLRYAGDGRVVTDWPQVKP